MVDLIKFLQSRVEQQCNRVMMIPRYLERPHAFAGRNDFSLNDIPKIKQDIAECKAAIKAIEQLRKEKANSSPDPDKQSPQ
jgi:hypothetical protein